MYGTDILRSYSAAAIHSPQSNGCSSEWMPPRSSVSREPLRLKLSILSDMNPSTRSILNGGHTSASSSSPMRSYPSTWSTNSEVPDRSKLDPDDGLSTPNRLVGIKRTASYWTPPNDYEEADHFVANTRHRNRLGSEPSATYYANKCPVGVSSNYSRRTSNHNSNGSPHHDRPKELRDVDDELDEVFASIVRGALSNGDSTPPQRQTSYDDDDNGRSYSNTATRTNKKNNSTSPSTTTTARSADLIQPFKLENREKPFHHHRQHQHLEKVSAGAGVSVGVKNDSTTTTSTSQLRNEVDNDDSRLPPSSSSTAGNSWSYQPYYYRSYAASAAAAAAAVEIEKRRTEAPVLVVAAGFKKPTSPIEVKEIAAAFPINRTLQKSEPFLHRGENDQEDLDDDRVESIDQLRGRGREERRSTTRARRDESSSTGKDRCEEDEFAPSQTTSYYYSPALISSTTSESNNRRGEGGGEGSGLLNQWRRTSTTTKLKNKLRTAKSESSLRMANKELLLSDKEIYQIEIMNSGLSANRIYVCQCLANLYFDDGATSSSSSTSNNNENKCNDGAPSWRRIATGVPVLVLETEPQQQATSRSTKDVRQGNRKLLIRLAELGNGFKLWEDVIDAFSAYSIDRTFHTMSTSADSRRRAGLSFDSHSAALKFHQHVRELSEELDSFGASDGLENGRRRYGKSIWAAFRKGTSTSPSSADGHHGTAAGSNLRQPDYGYASRRSSNWQSMPSFHDSGPVKKTDISLPCCFKHVTSLKAGDMLPSAVLVSPPPSSTSCPPSSANTTLTRVNRSATIRSPINNNSSKSQSSTMVDDVGYVSINSPPDLASSSGIMALPKRAQSCTQILSDRHSLKLDLNDDEMEGPNSIVPYHQLTNNSNASSGYLSNETPPNHGSLLRRYPHSVEPVI